MITHTKQPQPWWPKHWNYVPDTNYEDLQQLGSEMLRDLADYWDHQAAVEIPKARARLGRLLGIMHQNESMAGNSPDRCMTRCSECPLARMERTIFLTHPVCELLEATGFSAAYKGHESWPSCVINREPAALPDLMRRHLLWQVQKSHSDNGQAVRWAKEFYALALAAPYKPRHPTIVPELNVGDEVVINPDVYSHYVRGVIEMLDPDRPINWIIKHQNRNGTREKRSSMDAREILRPQEFEYLRANEPFARAWCEQQLNKGRHNIRRLRKGIKEW